MRTKKSKRSTEAISGTESKKLGGCGYLGCMLFSLPFFLGGAAVIYFLSIGPALKINEAKNWWPTPCIVTSSQVASSSDGDTYAVAITYSYTVDGIKYESDQYDFFGGYTSGHEGKAEIVRQNPAGKSAICYVNPDDPTDAVFHREFASDMWFGLFGLPFLLVGAGGFFFAIYTFIKERRSPAPYKAGPLTGPSFPVNTTSFDTASFNSPSFNPPGYSDAPPVTRPVNQPVNQMESAFQSLLINRGAAAAASPSTPAIPDGPVVLESKISPGCKLTAVTFFAVVWNVIVSIAVGWTFMNDWTLDNFNWIFDLIFSPFHIVGILLIVVVFYHFLALFNPRPKLTVSSGQLRVGEAFYLEWGFSVSTRAVSRLRIYLEGREEATYRRGTTTTTDKSVFATINIVDKPYGDKGRAQVTIPVDSMHSFKSDNNKIIWSIQVQGDKRFWPDVIESFDIEVLPKRLQRAAEL